MKKLIIFLFLSICTINVEGQVQRHDIMGSYGIVTTDQVVDLLADLLVTLFSFGEYSKDNYAYSGALFLTYKNSVTHRLNIGATIGLDRVNGDLINDQIKYGEFSTTHVTVAGEADLRWVKKDFFEMYTGLGLGYTFSEDKGSISATNETDILNTGHANLQFDLLGLRVGRNFGGFIETGFGYKGILNFGISYQF